MLASMRDLVKTILDRKWYYVTNAYFYLFYELLRGSLESPGRRRQRCLPGATRAHARRFVRAGEFTSTPIHTGEQIYLRQNFKDLIERHAVRVVGPDPCDVGGIAELKWIAEYADLHGILMAPHGTGNGLLGLAALVQVSATLPQNFIAFEYPAGDPAWWYDIVDGLPNPIVKDGHITVWDRPGMGVELVPERARCHLSPEDAAFFD
jgi:L-alanine-DL-glutamate epimerase-like enolase superfamily enzyme